MSIHRFVSRGPVGVEELQATVEQGLTITDVGGGMQIDVSLTDDNLLVDLTEVLESLGFEFVGTEPFATAAKIAGRSGAKLTFGSSAVALVATDFLFPGFALAVALGTEIQVSCPEPLEVSRMAVVHNGLGTGAGSVEYRLRVGAADSGLSATVAVTAGFGSDSVVSPIEIAADSLVSCSAVKSGTILTSPANVLVAVG